MKIILVLSFLTTLVTLAQESKGVKLTNGISPNKKFEVVLEADKGSPKYKEYELKGDETEFPAFLIRELSSGKILSRIVWQGDSNSDQQSLTKKSVINWNNDGSAVIINTSERFYSYSTVWFLDKDQFFRELIIPDYKTLTGFEKPNTEHLRPRGHTSMKWSEDGDLIYGIHLQGMRAMKNNDPLSHIITLRLDQKKGLTVINRK